MGHTDLVRSVAFSPNGQTLASGSDDTTVRLWQVSDGTLLSTLKGHTDWVRSVAFSPDGQTLASGSTDGIVQLWWVAIGDRRRALRVKELVAPFWDDDTMDDDWGSVLSVAFSPNGHTLALGMGDGTVWLWCTRGDVHVRILVGHTGPVYSVAFSPDGQTLASGSWDKTVRLRQIDW